MKFKLVEKFDETRSIVQDYMYDAMDELNNASLEEYIQWFKDNLTAYPEDIEQAVTDAYIEACDYGMIKGVEKTRLTSELKEYIESHTDIIDDTDELMRQCPEHLQHELKIVLSKLDESLNEELLTEETLTNIENIINTAFAGTGCIITLDPHKKFYLVRTPLNNTYCIPVIQQNVRSSNDYSKRRYKGNGTVVNGNLVDSSGTTLGPAYYGVPTNHNHYDYDDINLYQYSKYPAANGVGQTLSAFVQDVKSGKV